jgi:hypothetical protein
MSSSTRSILAVVAVLVLAGAAYWAWERFFSHAAQVERIHAACVAEFEAGKTKVKSGLPDASSARPGDPVGGAIRDLSAGLGKLIDEVAGNVSAAACGAIRESCRLDFEGDVCVRARAHYR